jgi:hypothetical protein
VTTVRVTLQVYPQALPEGMTEEDLVELVKRPFQSACVAATAGMKGARRDAFLLSAIPLLFHEALNHVGVSADTIHSWNAWTRKSSTVDVQLAVTWAKAIGATAHVVIDVP